MPGLSRITGKMIDGWDHLVQSLGVIISTAIESRVMRRPFGSRLPRLVDAPISTMSLIDFYAATAGAIIKYEPRFRVLRMKVEDASGGQLSLHAEGVFYPRGHLGDFNESIPKSMRLVV